MPSPVGGDNSRLLHMPRRANEGSPRRLAPVPGAGRL